MQRAAAWLVVAGWWVATFGLMFVQTTSTADYQCYFSGLGRLLQLVGGIAGDALATSSLLKGKEVARRRAPWLIAAFAAWLLFVVLVLPAMPRYCEGE